MPGESFLLIHDDCRQKADMLAHCIVENGFSLTKLPYDRKNALDSGREAFYELTEKGYAPVVAGYGRACALAVSIAQRCPVQGLICLWPEDERSDHRRYIASVAVARNLFLIVAPTLIAVDGAASYLAKRMIEQLPRGILTLVETDESQTWSRGTAFTILNGFAAISSRKSSSCVK
ncbi:MAG: hypothetical protein Q4D04_02180 [Clostridia bacterium]|nr:hypothetical protein [Clostridia bacterium]